ncbi:FitA-like ribbon-helix-helix domain-containing protein [Rhizobium ruizarguesonis]|uniref:FitA-like ribbon-helix-helix domain-containing protein n=1 Tax=Rhizobium ruizarguesonis TaxID=2081791 RepID=UPI00102FA7AA|nr:plasmid stabilization protein [Rhizobium ruizarguesonis]TBA51414.1 plasmid stabilization protein [Rhizobium ruizarguesonis]TBA93641.1 plasmid stabilization protein [Rhizobium ruizarguesonis]TBB37068.1 plasmid stabilization protein [Rhizobium ruizarguesonis]TBC00837.1 plasmid stabilization protein [Rhizobium ruizarguesonis]TBC04800.1 plasmid stabilization protein [Rhizobium ruizarguesonis]
MASMTIRNLDDGLKQRLRMRAATHGRSMEDEARDILRAALATGEPPARNLADAIRARLLSVGGVELDIPPREPIRDPPDFTA